MTITIAHTKGGVGKSTIAWNLALALWYDSYTVRVGDLDFQQTILLSSKMREELYGAETLERFEVTTPADQAELAALYPREADDIILLDIGGFDSALNRQAMHMADLIIVPISISLTEVLGFKTFEAILEDEGIDRSKVRILLNNIHPLVQNFSTIKEALGDEYRFFDTVIRRRSDYVESIGSGRCVTNDAPKKWRKAAAEIEHLIQEVYDYGNEFKIAR